MSSINIAGDSSGSIILTVPSVAGTNTATLPASTGTVMVSGNMPAFSAYLSANQTGISQNTWTKVTLNTKEFDTANCFDATTNYRFTPNVAGYYQINFLLLASSTTAYGSAVGGSIYKNGSRYKSSTVNLLGGSAGSTPLNEVGTQVSAVVYLNGSTDYVEFYGFEYGYSANGIIEGGQTWQTAASAVMVRGA